MKNLKSIFLAVLVMFSLESVAQNAVKIGYFDYGYVMSQMPEAKAAEADLKAYTEKLQKDLQVKESEIRAKYERYMKEGEKMAAPTREALEKEIQTGQQQLQEFQQKAEADVTRKQNTLLSPINDKLEKTLKEVAKENGFTYVLRKETLLYEPEDASLDVSILVLKKLGITPAAKTNTTGTTGTKTNTTGTGTKPR